MKKMKNFIFWCLVALLLAVILNLFIKMRKEENWDNLIKELSSDAYLKIGDIEVTVPLVALLEPKYAYTPHSFPSWAASDKKTQMDERTKFKALSSKLETAPKVDRIEILIEQYKYYGENLSSVKICPLLQRDWAKYFCRGEFQEIAKKLPEKFYIVDEKHTDLFSNHFTVGFEKMSDQIQKLNLESAVADISCDADGKFCTAGIRISNATLAIWTVWASEKFKKSAKQMAEMQGKAIIAFVKYGISSQPDFVQMRKEILSAD